MDEAELRGMAMAYREGREEGLEQLVNTLSRTLMAMAFRYTADWEWARDLTQETWIRVARNIESYDPERSFLSWLHGIHRNGCIDHVRRPWIRRELALGEDATPAAGEDRRDDPLEALERKELRRSIMKAAGELSEAQRAVFLRVDVEDGDQRAVARELGMREGTLRVTLHHARKRVAAALRRAEEGAS